MSTITKRRVVSVTEPTYSKIHDTSKSFGISATLLMEVLVLNTDMGTIKGYIEKHKAEHKKKRSAKSDTLKKFSRMTAEELQQLLEMAGKA